MKSSHNIRRVSASALLVIAAGCSDSLTQAKASAKQSTIEADAPTGPAPTLLATAKFGTSGDFAGDALQPPSRPGYFYSVAIRGVGFTAGAGFVAHFVAVGADGTKYIIASGGGDTPSDGTYTHTWAASCPSHYAEMYDMVTSNGRTVESNHVTPGC